MLCQQPLKDQAVERLLRFENYIAGEAKKDAARMAAERDAKVKMIRESLSDSVGYFQSLLGEYAGLSEGRKGITDTVTKFVQTAHQRKAGLLSAVQSMDFSDIAELDDSVIRQLCADTQALEEEAINHESVAVDDGERECLRFALHTLQDQKRLSENIEAILTRRNDLELKARLQQCFDDVGTRNVSHKVSELRRELVTEDLKNRIRAEVQALDLEYIPLQITDASERGESGYEMKLNTWSNANTSDVLSEGEQHALGIACFLADVNGQPAKHGIILDDPVSSLDHVRVAQVADRLVKEAATGRQVIVFTHSLLFYSEMESKAASHTPRPVPVLSHIVRRSDTDGFGVVDENAIPWKAKPVHDRINQIEENLNKLESMGDADYDDQRQQWNRIHSDLRESWERLVEELLLNKVVVRYKPDVKTQSLKGVIVEDEDHRTIYWAMKRVSEWSGHDMPTAKDKLLPKIRELREEVKLLEEFRRKVKKRLKKTEQRRKALESPPQAKTA